MARNEKKTTTTNGNHGGAEGAYSVPMTREEHAKRVPFPDDIDMALDEQGLFDLNKAREHQNALLRLE